MAAAPLQVPTSSGSAGAVSVDAGRFRVSRTAFATGVLPSHYHERACLSVVLEGSFTEHFRSRAFDCRPCGVLLKAATERHYDVLAGSLQVIVEPDDSAVIHLGESPRIFDCIAYSHNAVAGAVAWRIARELHGMDAFTSLAVEGLTLELLCGVLRAGAGPSPGRSAPPWLSRVRERIDDGQSLPTVADLAELAQVHPAYLARCFRERYGVSLGQYARRTRLERTVRQLTETTTPLSAIALSAGFADQSHFTRAFRARWGVTPRQYRLATRGQAR